LVLLSSVTEVYRDYKAPSCGKSHLGALVNAWNLFIEHCGDIPLDSVTPGHVYEFLQARMQAEHKPWSGMRALQFGRPVLREIFGLPRIRRPKRLVLGRHGVLHLDHHYALGVLQVGPASEVHDASAISLPSFETPRWSSLAKPSTAMPTNSAPGRSKPRHFRATQASWNSWPSREARTVSIAG